MLWDLLRLLRLLVGRLKIYRLQVPRESAASSELALRSESTIRKWCNEKGIGRRIAGGKWDISRVALQMVLENDEIIALKAHLTGDRASECVKTYFDRYGIPLLKLIRTTGLLSRGSQ